MIVFIAREGVEKGAYERADLSRFARNGELEPTDYYWHEGMEDWLLLAELLDPEAWEPAAESPALPKQSPRYAVMVAGAVCALVVTASVARCGMSRSPSLPAVALPAPDLERTNTAIRNKATDDLVAKVTKLPSNASSSSPFYYGLTVTVPDPPVALSATVAGVEDVVDPATQRTRWHTPFSLTLTYRDGQWMYRDYRASTTDLANASTTEIDGSKKAAIQPTIVSLLGLKEAPDRIEHEETTDPSKIAR